MIYKHLTIEQRSQIQALKSMGHSQIDAYPGQYQLYQYRDKDKREIDFIVEQDDGSLIGIEVKAGSTVSRKSFKHMEWFSQNIVKNKIFIGVVLYTGADILSFGNNMYALPITYLWQ